MNKPLVSVIIPTYNRGKYVVKAIDSVLVQSYGNIEIIVVDDASIDGTGEIMSGLAKKCPNIIYIKNDHNLGFVRNLNKGISFAKGEYIARLDDDDIWCDPLKLEKQVGFLEKNKEYVLIGGGVVRVDMQGLEVARYLLPETDAEIKKAILVDNVFAHSAMVFRKSTFLKAMGYDGRFGFFADWALWLEIGKMGKFYNFQEFFIHYLDQEGNKPNSNRDYEIRRKLMAKIALNRKYRNYYTGGNKAFALYFASYCYSFIPFRKKLWPVIFQIRKLFFGAPPYKYFNEK